MTDQQALESRFKKACRKEAARLARVAKAKKGAR